MCMFRFATMVSTLLVACGGGANAQQRTPVELVATIQAKLAVSMRECVTFNEAMTRACFKDYRLSIRNGRLINSYYNDFLFAKSNYQPTGYKPQSVRIELEGLKPAITIKRPGYSGEEASYYVEMRCEHGKCVTAQSGNEFDSHTFLNINDELSANEIASLMNQLIAVCKAPKECQ